MKYFLKKIERINILRLSDESLAKVLALRYDYDYGQMMKIYHLIKKPKYNLYFGKEYEDGEIEIDEEGVDDLYLSLGKRKGRFNEFFRTFEPLYRQRRVSMLFITITTPYTLEELKNDELEKELKAEWSKFWKAYRLRLKRKLGEVYGYAKLTDVGAEGHRLHFHIVVVIPRIRLAKIPDWLKPDKGLWKWQTRVEFIRKSVRSYLMNYLGKPMFNLPTKWRSYEVKINWKAIYSIYSGLSIYSVNDTKRNTKK